MSEGTWIEIVVQCEYWVVPNFLPPILLLWNHIAVLSSPSVRWPWSRPQKCLGLRIHPPKMWFPPEKGSLDQFTKNSRSLFWNVYQTVASSSTSANQRASAVTLNNKLLTRCTFDDFFRLIYPSQRQNLLPTFEIITQYTPSQWKFCGNFWRLWIFFWKISNYNFQSRRQIMIIRGVYSQKMTKYDGELSKKDENFHKKGGNYTKMRKFLQEWRAITPSTSWWICWGFSLEICEDVDGKKHRSPTQ